MVCVPNIFPAWPMCASTEYGDLLVCVTGHIFRVPLSTLCQPKEDGGWNLTRLYARSHELLLYRMRQQIMNPRKKRRNGCGHGVSTSKAPILHSRIKYPHIWNTCGVLRCIRPMWTNKGLWNPSVNTRCNTFYHISRSEIGMQEMRITKMWPTTNWNAVWKNIHDTPVPEGTKAAWYKVIHNILPINDRFYKVRMSPTNKFINCGMHDTVQQRLFECREGWQIWKWTT